jgi:hypothetical protein
VEGEQGEGCVADGGGGGGRAHGEEGKSAAAGRGSSRSMETTMPLPNARLCSVYRLEGSEDVASRLDTVSSFFFLFPQ